MTRLHEDDQRTIRDLHRETERLLCSHTRDLEAPSADERKRGEEVLRESEQRFRTLVEASMDAIIAIDPDGRITIFNPAAEEMFGLPEEQILGKPVDGLMPEKYRQRHRQARTAFFATGQPSRLIGKTTEVCGVRSDGEVFPIELSLSAGQCATGRFVVAIIRDITDRRRIERALQEAYDDLEDRVERRTAELAAANAVLKRQIADRKRAEERFRKLLESAPDAMVIIDRERRITLVNTETERLFGYSREELLGRPVEILIPERFRSRHPAKRMSYVADSASRASRIVRERCGLRKDGSEFPAEISVSPLETEEGILISSAIRDISDRKRTERELREKESQLLAARRIQMHLLPDAPPDLPGFDVAGASYPADFTAGDYFDYLTMPDGSVGLVIADVSGHGFAPALLAACTHALVRSLANHHTDIGEILGIANSVLVNDTEDDRFVTLLLGRLDPRTPSFTYTSAGHQTGYLLDSSGRVKACLESTAVPLAVLPDIEFPACDPVTLEPGDVLVLLTDGFLEAISPAGVPFGMERTLDVIRANRHRAAVEIIERLHQQVGEFVRSDKLTDDITAVVVKVDSRSCGSRTPTTS